MVSLLGLAAILMLIDEETRVPVSYHDSILDGWKYFNELYFSENRFKFFDVSVFVSLFPAQFVMGFN